MRLRGAAVLLQPDSSCSTQLVHHVELVLCCPSPACRHRLCCLTVQHTTSQPDVQVTGAEAALRKMLPLVFSKEQGGCLLLHACWACSARNSQTHQTEVPAKP